MKRDLFLFAGEVSGDALGGGLISALKKKDPSLSIYGVGGKKMREEGLIPLMHTEEFCVMGFSAVLKALFPLIKKFHTLKRHLLAFPPKAVLLIDYPVFNMMLAKALRRGGYKGKIIHYVAPTVWAWKKKRAYTLAKTHDLLLSILPFEKAHFSKTKLKVEYVGHPLAQATTAHQFVPQWRDPTYQGKDLIAIFPGSRKEQIAHNLPLQIDVALSLLQKNPPLAVAISVADDRLLPLIQQLVPAQLPCFYVKGVFRYELMKEAFLALATSGTVTLELALFETPTVVFYQLTRLNYFLVRHFFRIRLPFISLVNLICNREVFPEFVHLRLSSQEMKYEAERLFSNAALRASCIASCRELKQHLSESNPSERAAHHVLECLS